jgi:glutathione synthase/RimK-type ligase-like ATP-grasp enzyme
VRAAPRVALATDREHPELDADGPLLLAALARRGIEAAPAVWDDPAVDWAGFDLVVVRCTWDYVPRREQWLTWAEALPRVANPADLLRWSTDKRYLRELAAAGLPVVPTVWLEPGDGTAVAGSAVDAWNEPELVVKPVVSAGSADTTRHRDRAQAHRAANRLLDTGRAVMVQPYLAAVDAEGETAVLHLAGAESHAVRKAPMLRPDGRTVHHVEAAEHISARQASAAERALAERVLDAVPGGRDRLLYARVDLLPGPVGEPVVVELELAEPSLFLRHDPAAADRLAGGVEELLASGGCPNRDVRFSRSGPAARRAGTDSDQAPAVSRRGDL